MSVLLVALGAAVGAPLRYLLDRAIQARHGTPFPWGTFAVNAAGSFLLGLLATGALATPAPLFAALGTGLCGTLTTYSTFGYETVRLFRDGSRRYASLYVIGSIAGGLGAAYLGTAVAQVFT